MNWWAAWLPTSDEYRVEKYGTFLNNLEQWIDATIIKEGLTDEKLILGIKDSYLRSLRASYEHHQMLAKAMSDGGDPKSAKRHALLANVYKALVGDIRPDSDPEQSN